METALHRAQNLWAQLSQEGALNRNHTQGLGV